MLPEKTKRANIAAAVWFISMFALLAMVMSSDGGNLWDDNHWLGISILVVHGISFFAALWYYAEAKGYSGALGLGLGLLYGLGLIILLLLRDKSNTESTFSETTSATPSRHWKVFLTFLCIIIASGVLGFSQASGDPAYLIGYYLFPSIVVAAISYALFGRGGGKGVGTTIFIAVYLSFLIGSLLAVEFQREEAVEGISYFLDQAEELLEAQDAAAVDGVPIDKTFSANASATGSMAAYQQFMAHVLNQSAALTNEYLAELEEIGWYTILDPTRLQADRDFSASKRILEGARLLVEKYKARSIAVLKESQNEIRKLDLSLGEKRDFEAGFERGMGNAMSSHEEIWRLELATVDEFGKLLEFLAEEPRFWTVDEGQFMFDSQEQLDQFNGHVETIDYLAQRELEIQKSNLDAQREKLKDF